MAANNLPQETQKREALSVMLNRDEIRKRFEQVLGKKAAGFMSSIISAVNANDELKKADPLTIISAAAVAASLDLPINPSLGFAHIVPYGGKAQFQMGWRGFVQLGMRSGQYKTINTCQVYEGELIDSNRFTGEMFFDESKRKSDRVIGYVAYFKLINGYEKYLYMTVDQVTAHGKQYSRSFDHPKGKWKTDFEAMALKTPLKLLLSRWGILSLEMQSAVQYDQATIKNLDGSAYVYDDGPDGDGKMIDMPTNAEMVAVFDASIPKGTDAAILGEFLTRTAESNKSTVEGVQIEAVKELPKFWKIYAAYEKQMKAKKTNGKQESSPIVAAQEDPTRNQEAAPAATIEQMAPAVCPDHPETTYTKAFCDACAKRQECPVW